MTGQNTLFSVRRNHKVQRLCDQPCREGFASDAIHRNRSQAQREQARGAYFVILFIDLVF